MPVAKKRNLNLPGCLLAVAVTMVGAIFSLVFFEMRRPIFYEKGSDFPKDNLPPSAHNVRVRYGVVLDPIPFSYEFECSEEDFRSWAAATREKVPKISEVREEKNVVCFSHAPSGEFEMRTIPMGLIADWRLEDQSQCLVYDRERGLAMRWLQSR